MFNRSNYPEDHQSGITTGGNKVTGMMKDEAGGNIIEEFVGFNAKLYNYKIKGEKGKRGTKIKGIKAVIKNIAHNNYECLFSGNMQMSKMNVIRTNKHEVFTENINKIALNTNDDKKIIREIRYIYLF